MKTLVTEKLLLYKVRIKKDTDAFAKLYDFYVGPVYRFVYFKLSNKEDAEDITSEVFLKTWNYIINEVKPVNNFRQLVYTIARNKVIDAYRDRSKKLECPIENFQDSIVSDKNSVHDNLELKDNVNDVLNKIKKLKHEYQEVIHLKYIEGLKIKEIASVLDKSSTNVRVLLHRATKKLKELTESNK
jgi:RNA polymerase sigma-70 factor (ECF subfamily)